MGSPKRFSVRSKIWIEDENGDIVFGSGRLRIFDAIDRNGSILGAARDLHMSYRAVWGKIKATEERLGRRLLVKKTGGHKGGGSILTPEGRRLVECFRNFQTQTEKAAEIYFKDILAEILAPDDTTDRDAN